MRVRGGAHFITLVLAGAAVISTAGVASTSTISVAVLGDLRQLLSRRSFGAPLTGTTPNRRAEAQELIVFAAASLTDAFQALGSDFEQAHPDMRVRFNFAGSQQLASQILAGAPADVFACADPRQVQAVGPAAVGEPQTFAVNELVIVVERDNPLRVQGLADLTRADLTLVLAAEEVPVGRYARQVLERAGVKVAAASLENDVRAVLFKVRLGEADAGIVYASDVLAAGNSVAAVPIPPDENLIARYPIAVLASAPNPDAGQAFVSFVQSVEGQAVLRRYGFSLP